MQVDPVKPPLTAPGKMRLKLEYDESLSIFAFNFNLRRHMKEAALDDAMQILEHARREAGQIEQKAQAECEAGPGRNYICPTHISSLTI